MKPAGHKIQICVRNTGKICFNCSVIQVRNLVAQLGENTTVTKQVERNWWHQGIDRPEKIKTFRTQPIF
jgi:hypothetical protein